MERLDPKRTLNNRELLFMAYLLDQGADAIFKRICEDMHPDVEGLLTLDEQDDLMWQGEQHNSGGADYDAGWWCWQGSIQSLNMAHRLRLYLAAQVGIEVSQRYDTDALMREIKARLLAP